MLKLIYQDEDMVVVDKPSGLLSVPGRHVKRCLLNQVLERFPTARVVHRLDQATSGVMVYALNYDAQKQLSIAFAERTVAKEYIAVCDGVLRNCEGEINLPIIVDWPNRPRQKICFDTGKSALTQYKVIEKDSKNAITRVKLLPYTGRSHQLRIHMLAIGHPILGDEFYAPKDVIAKSSRLLLHARTLSLPHPRNGENINCTVEPEF